MKRNDIARNTDYGVILIYLILVLMGLTNIYSYTFDESYPSLFSFNKEYGKQIIWILLSLIAGFSGIISGGLILMLVNKLVGQGEDAFMRNPSVPIGIVFLALLIVITLGTLIGLIPAIKATNVKPIDALREE